MKQSLLVLSFVQLLAFGLSAQRLESKIQNDSRLVSTEFLNLNWEDRLNHILHSDSIFDSERYQQEGRVPFLAFSHFEFEQSLGEEQFYLEGPELEYINRIHQRLLQSNEALAKATQVVLINDFQVNAFCYPNGVIAITTGLLARLETEGELAFVIAHEAAHYALDHSFIRHSSSEMEEEEDYFSSNKSLYAHREYLKRSKEHELAADSEAVKIMQAAGYGIAEAEALLIKLFRSDLPMEMKPLSQSPLIDGIDFQLPEQLVLKDTAGFKTNYNYRDEGHTHPNIGDRIKEIRKQKLANGIGLKFKVDKVEFNHLRSWGYTQLMEKGRIGYNAAHVLYELASYKDLLAGQNVELDYRYYKCFYMLAALMHQEKYSLIIPEINYIEGPAQAYYYSLKQLSMSELVLLVLANLDAYNRRYGDIERFKEVEWALLALVLEKEKTLNSTASLIMKNSGNGSKSRSFDSSLELYLKSFKGKRFEELANSLLDSYGNRDINNSRIYFYQSARRQLVTPPKRRKWSLGKRTHGLGWVGLNILPLNHSADNSYQMKLKVDRDVDFVQPKVIPNEYDVDLEGIARLNRTIETLTQAVVEYGGESVSQHSVYRSDSIEASDLEELYWRKSKEQEIMTYFNLKIPALIDPFFKETNLLGSVEMYSHFEFILLVRIIDPYTGELLVVRDERSSYYNRDLALKSWMERIIAENILK